MSERYELRIGDDDWREVTKAEFILAERQCGFAPKGFDSFDKRYYTRLATAGFETMVGRRKICARIVKEPADA